ncbi:hypothetical protein F5B22DRAFT_322864 [Xylaria bambusicola]|uniref:uncharacterized protein n=1 Tax=Xylaria bambusicola TaxID=326684 RepID=UPI002007A719|nr:uncharacterized protein F5B22DRAFT_322864 [Xylaria bambusicola]KAI0509480.1 hypothetical protein F5B22DRAFT_322864 [Xylaria bambusicola]
MAHSRPTIFTPNFGFFGLITPFASYWKVYAMYDLERPEFLHLGYTTGIFWRWVLYGSSGGTTFTMWISGLFGEDGDIEIPTG